MDTITAILNIYKRPHLTLKQIEYLDNQTVRPNKIIIWDNSEVSIDLPKRDDIIHIKASKNQGMYPIWSVGLYADTDYLVYFDDDTFPGKMWIENCLEQIKKRDGIYGTYGITLLGDGYHPYSITGWIGNKSDIPIEVDIVAHSWFMKKSTIKYLFREDIKSLKNGGDIQLCYAAKKYGNIPSIVPPHPENKPEMWGSDYHLGRLHGEDENATSRLEDHKPIRESIVKDFLKSGWRIQRNRRKIIYTCITGNYDTLKEPLVKIPKDWELICFTNNPNIKSDNWKIILLDNEEGLDNCRLARKVKILPHLFISDWDILVWIDGNLTITDNIDDFLTKYAGDDTIPIHTTIHPIRKCTYAEMHECAAQNKDSKDIIENQFNKYVDLGFPTNLGLPQTNCIVRYKSTEILEKFQSIWFDEILNGSKRDQLSFMFAGWKSRNEPEHLRIGMFDSSTVYNGTFKLSQHNHGW